ncbi:MAG: chemotaxis protein CheD [Spirochaetales bacterium]|nr:chemotaxis protein CheD [Spirochaetales bacterium]
MIKYYLKPGWVYATQDPVVIETVLGSCVSVFLFDERLRVGGANHIIYPQSPPDQPTTKYGDIAMRVLFRLMHDFGSRPADLTARLVGCASIADNPASVAAVTENLATAERFLRRQRIPVASRETGGHRGRKVAFETATGRLTWQFLT